MATRRARIKAVTALPPRRKNAENNDNKLKPDPIKSDTENKIPRTPQASKQNLPPETSPLKTVPSPVRVRTPVTIVNVSTPEPQITPITHKKSSTPTQVVAEKVSVITSSTKSVFLSPQVRNNLHRKVTQVTPKLQLDKEITIPVDTNRQHNISKQDIIKATVQYSLATERKNKDDYNVASVPGSASEDTGMDGIIPLQATSSAPKPIAILKNEIISENAEVLFDPIVPLPSPSKVRPKLRPVPRLGPLRRNSVQGSASESEDENRKALLSGGAHTATPTAARQRNDSHTSHSTVHSHLNKEVNRVRNDSVCSSMSQVVQPIAGSPVKEKNYSKSRKQYMNRRMAAMKRRRENIKRDAMTMYDLIFFNPTTKPIVPDQDEIEAKAASRLDAKKAAQEVEEEVDDPPIEDTAPVPQMKLGPNGEIVLDEQSLVIKNSDKRTVTSVVREGAWSTGGGVYRRSARTADWSDEETVRFYRALAALGTDFTMMEQLFPGRRRTDLKKKFKKEEKLNGAQVDKALKAGTLWDVSKLCKEFVEEREATRQAIKARSDRLIQEKIAEKERQQTVRDFKLKQSKSSRMLGSSSLPERRYRGIGPASAEEIFEDVVLERRKRKQEIAMEKMRSEAQTPPSKNIKILSNISLSRNLGNTELAITLDGRTKTTGNTDAVNRTPNNNSIDLTKDRTFKTYSKLDTNKTPRGVGSIEIPRDIRTPTHDVSSIVPKNIETGSLVVLTVEDPNAPTKKILQTYISNDKGALTPISLPNNLLNSVVGYMNKGTPKSNISVASSPSLISPNSVVNHDERATPSGIQLSPVKRKRNSSYTITHL